MAAATIPSLPPLRGEIKLFPAPRSHGGSPEFTLYDQVTGIYKRIGWVEATIIKFWQAGKSPEEMVRELSANTTLCVTVEDIHQFIHLAQCAGLLKSALTPGRTAPRPVNWFQWLLKTFFYIRIPLIHPEPHLRRSLPFAERLLAFPFPLFLLLISVAGLFMLTSRWDAYLHTFPYFLTAKGALAYGVTLILLKLLHEFSHAYTAAHFGVRVRSMGVLLIFFWPLAYSDVTDAWRIPQRFPRFCIGFAGIALELIIAGLALFGWCISPPGMIRSLFFLVSSYTLIASLLVNLNPAMRFDGYYILSDLWGIDNLQQRAFAMTRWQLRRWFLGWQAPPPEMGVEKRRLAGFMFYSIYAWGYRLLLFSSLAYLLYQQFAKVIGIVLAAGLLWAFIAGPIIREVRTLMKSWITTTSRVWITGSSLAALLLVLLLPLPWSVSTPAILVPERSQTLYAPFAGFLLMQPRRSGDQVLPGQLLFEIQSPELDAELQINRLKEMALLAKQRIAAAENGKKDALPELREELGKVRAKRKALEERKNLCRIHSILKGTLLDVDESRRTKESVKEGVVLGRVVALSQRKIIAYLPEKSRRLVETGQAATFYPNGNGDPMPARLLRIHRSRANAIEHVALTSESGGPILTKRSPDGKLMPIQTYFLLDAKIDNEPSDSLVWRTGVLQFRGKPRSLLFEFFGYLWTVFIQESSF